MQFEVGGGGYMDLILLEAQITKGMWGHAHPENFEISTSTEVDSKTMLELLTVSVLIQYL